MSHRLSTGGRLIDRARPVRFTFDGRAMTGLAGDTLASALLASGQVLMGRSFKYHRPRGVVGAGVEEPNALMGIGAGGHAEPNQRATVQPLHEGLTATSQNRWPSLAFDVGAINARLSRFLPAGFYYKTFLWPRAFWKHVYEPIIRASAGLGRPPQRPDAEHYEHLYHHADVVIAGGGIAGLSAALRLGRAGARVLLVEQGAHWGGRAMTDGATVDGGPAEAWISATVAALAAMPNVAMRLRTTCAGVYDHGQVLCAERLTDHLPLADRSGPRQRLWRVRAGQVIAATGAIERPLSFANNDLPGVMLAGAVRDMLDLYGVACGDRTVVVTNNDDAYRTAFALLDAGLDVPAVIDARPDPAGPLVEAARARGIRVLPGHGVAKAKGRARVDGVAVCRQDGAGEVVETIPCDALAMSGGWSPAVHLWSHTGGKLTWDEAGAMFVPDPDRPPTGDAGQPTVICTGAAAGNLRRPLDDAPGTVAARLDLTLDPAPEVAAQEDGPIRPVWMMPEHAGPDLRAKAFLDFQNDVKVSDVALAAQEGFESVEHAKRYTTLGMATDQGKLSNVNGLAVLAASLSAPIPEVGTTTFRPPYTPVTMGALAGEARGNLFQPLRRTPLHDWHEANGAKWEPVGQWRRPYCYPRTGETKQQAVAREITNTRTKLGLLDASTLGKIVVKGPDAGRFLDMIYTNMMSTLKPGRCRYGLMCSDNGFLIDDGVVARLSGDAWLCHTTTGGADRIHAHMEEWLQTEWWDWQVHTANVTEQWAQIAVVGPNARRALERLGGMDVSAEALPFMAWAEGTLADIPARVFRISFSGELSYEVAVPASRGPQLWDALHALTDLSPMPYGTEALHVMRAEKGFIMIGDETDGTVIPQDLGLDWALSKKKDDYLGKRAHARSHMADPDRWRLVGLQTLDGSVLEDGALALAEGTNALGQRRTQGRVTSTYHSPTLGRGIAMALVHRGTDRLGEVLRVTRIGKDPVEARIVDPVLYDPDGERLNG
ncbi:MAG: sarcosine oxidase subunit alpha family protein [Paracoccaceae bacterium]